MCSTSFRLPDRPADGPTQQRLRYWLALLRAPGLGGRGLMRTSVQPGFPESMFQKSRSELAASGFGEALIAYFRAPDWAGVARDLAWLEHAGHDCITLEDDLYPPLLKEIPSPPPVLFTFGDVKVLDRPQIALVGSRNPSPRGESTAFDFASALVSSGLVVTSGLAVGIDAASHRGALAAGGFTVAVVGTGLDQTYPRRNRELMGRIAAEGGVLVSEFPIGTPPKAVNFPRRNRIISGLSLGTLVVEATLRSGSLITARLAAEQGREVFAIPGSIHNPLARGCHALIRQGAKLVETVSDILEELRGFTSHPSGLQANHSAEGVLDAPSDHLLKYVACEPTSVDTLVAASGFSAEQVSSLLLVLELDGYVASTAAGCYCRIT